VEGRDRRNPEALVRKESIYETGAARHREERRGEERRAFTAAVGLGFPYLAKGGIFSPEKRRIERSPGTDTSLRARGGRTGRMQRRSRRMRRRRLF
jgi:hypothetical protein